jgi:hypothetical protein
MEDKTQGKAKNKKPPREPEKEFLDAMYRLPDGGYGQPAMSFKNAFVNACRYIDGIPMTFARGALHVMGDLVRIEGSDPEMDERPVRLQGKTAQVRYRPIYKDWRVTLRIKYNASAITPEQIVHQFNVAGFAVGIGEYRPEKNGNLGMFHVATEGEL